MTVVMDYDMIRKLYLRFCSNRDILFKGLVITIVSLCTGNYAALLPILKELVPKEGEREVGCLPPSLLPCTHLLPSLLWNQFLQNW